MLRIVTACDSSWHVHWCYRERSSDWWPTLAPCVFSTGHHVGFVWVRSNESLERKGKSVFWTGEGERRSTWWGCAEPSFNDCKLAWAMIFKRWPWKTKGILIHPGMHVVLIFFNELTIGIFQKQWMFILATQHWNTMFQILRMKQLISHILPIMDFMSESC